MSARRKPPRLFGRRWAASRPLRFEPLEMRHYLSAADVFDGLPGAAGFDETALIETVILDENPAGNWPGDSGSGCVPVARVTWASTDSSRQEQVVVIEFSLSNLWLSQYGDAFAGGAGVTFQISAALLSPAISPSNSAAIPQTGEACSVDDFFSDCTPPIEVHVPGELWQQALHHDADIVVRLEVSGVDQLGAAAFEWAGQWHENRLTIRGRPLTVPPDVQPSSGDQTADPALPITGPATGDETPGESAVVTWASQVAGTPMSGETIDISLQYHRCAASTARSMRFAAHPLPEADTLDAMDRGETESAGKRERGRHRLERMEWAAAGTVTLHQTSAPRWALRIEPVLLQSVVLQVQGPNGGADRGPDTRSCTAIQDHPNVQFVDGSGVVAVASCFAQYAALERGETTAAPAIAGPNPVDQVAGGDVRSRSGDWGLVPLTTLAMLSVVGRNPRPAARKKRGESAERRDNEFPTPPFQYGEDEFARTFGLADRPK